MAHATQWPLHSRRAAGAALAAATLLAHPHTLHAEPVPVVLVGTQSEPAGTGHEAVDRVAATLGPDALVGTALAARVTSSYASPHASGDPLAEARDRAHAAQRAWSDASAADDAAAQQRALAALGDAVTAMERAPEALDEHEPDRAAYQRALLFLAERYRAAQMTTQADEALLRLARFDPSAVLAPTAASAETRAAFARTVETMPRGALTVQSVPTGCNVLRDGRPVGTAPVELTDLSPGDHRIAVSCGAVRSLVHHAQVAPNARGTVVIDPQLDAALSLDPSPELRYASLPQGRARLAQDLAVLGRALGARRVVGVIAANDRAVVVDVASGAEVGNADVAEEPRVRSLVTQAVTTATTTPAARGSATGPGSTTGVLGNGRSVTVTHTRGGAVPAGAIVLGVIGLVAVGAGAYLWAWSDDAMHRGLQATDAGAHDDDANASAITHWSSIGALAGGGVMVVTGVLIGAFGRSTETMQLRASVAPLRGGGALASVRAAF